MILRTGDPQGSVLSPALLNFFVSDCPGHADSLFTYTDDITAAESHPDMTPLSDKLLSTVVPIIDWTALKNF
jgi:hypothetical protein